VGLASENATYVPSFDFSPTISIGVDHVQVFFSNVNVCPAWSPASALPTTSGFGHCISPATLVCAATADADNNVRPTMLTMRSFIQPLSRLPAFLFGFPARNKEGEKRADPVFDVADSGGYKALTSWSGELRKNSPFSYVAQYISLYTTSSAVPPPPESMEMDGVRGAMTFLDCDNIKITYDRYLVYFDLSKIVFVDPADINIDITGFVETYHRMPMTCPACSLAAAPTTQLRQKR
jgi:hypothetical protein